MNPPGDFAKIRDEQIPCFLHTLFENSAREYFASTAVVFGTESITYKELNQKADKLCISILNYASAEDTIAISTTRSIQMVIGILAILKAGKACLPLDPSYPHLRIKQIIADAGIKWGVSTKADASFFTKFGLVLIREEEISIKELQLPGKVQTVAYVLYTSGSTGKPKGVCMGHEALVNLMRWQQKKSAAARGTKTLQFAPLSFDVSFQEIFATLTTGGTLVLIENEVRADPLKLLSIIQEEEIGRIFLPFVALQYLAEMAVSAKLFPARLREIITAGEQLKITPQITGFLNKLPGCILCNQYGPTECHVVTELQLTGDPGTWPLLPSIGKPIDGVEIFITDEDLNPLPVGEIGELIITGRCIAEGYLNQPEMTAEKFPKWNFPGRGLVRIYRTGDIAKYLPNGEIEFYGRRDGQVKIHGNRVELGEIEAVLVQHPDIKQAAVIASKHMLEQSFLVAYFVSNKSEINLSAIREFVAKALPGYMVPSHFILMKEFPTTTSGKVDKLLLPAPEFKRSDLFSLYKRPVTLIEKNITNTWISIFHLDRVGTDDNFFELGGNSLLAQKTVLALKNQFNYILPVTKLYQFPTVSEIAKFLQQETSKPAAAKPASGFQSSPVTDVAIIGMAGRFPGANTVEELWEVLKDGRETIRFFTKSELDSSIPDDIRNNPDYISARGIIDDADKFDAAFFELNPKLAELMDPQQRIFLEITWELLEKTGHLPQKYNGNIGVYAGTGNNTYYANNVLAHPELVNQVGSFQVMTANEKDYISSRTAYHLNLKGPAVSVYSACSTSLLAITQAVESIRRGQCDVAIAGGASITSPVNSGHLYQEGAMLSVDGHCRSFDANASGTVFSDGAGVVLLKSMEAAKADGDTIYAVIRGVGINNDGGRKGSFTLPSSEGQAKAIAMAINDAGIEPSAISYIETHGTATPLGDPIEIEGLKLAFGYNTNSTHPLNDLKALNDLNDPMAIGLNENHSPHRHFCAIGSVKSNLGHLTAAAGVTGLIKTVLALHNRQIPASLGFINPNPNIDFENSPFYVNTKLAEWKSETTRRAGVSSFGVGGTNVHIVLEEFVNEVAVSTTGRPLELITWSAKCEVSREAYALKLADYLNKKSALNLADAAFTLQTSRAGFNCRRFILANNTNETINSLLKDPISSQTNNLKELPGEVVFIFPGQGSQYLEMGKELYKNESIYKEAIDECAAILLPYIGLDIRQIIFPVQLNQEAEELLKDTRFTQPALFITEYALAKLWMFWGIEPTVLCGHSIGEFVAAHFAGIFTLPDALKLIATRGQMVSELPRGSMLSVRMPAKELTAILPKGIAVAAINTNQLCVVAGDTEEIASFSKLLDSKQLANKNLSTSHAFHSAMMDSIIEDFEKVVSTVNISRPRKPIVSTVTGSWLTDAEATDPHYWAKHLRSTVLFAEATETILEQENVLFLEVGPGNVLSALVRQQSGNRNIKLVTSLEKNSYQKSDYECILKALGQLWINGLEPDWELFYGRRKRNKINLPTYSFDKRHCWLNPVKNAVLANQQPNRKTVPVEIVSNHLVSRKENLINKIKDVLENASGIDTSKISTDITLLEMGLDSLLMTQIAITLKKEFGLPFKFRQLNEELATIELLAQYLDENLPAELFQTSGIYQAQESKQVKSLSTANTPDKTVPETSLELIAQQLQILTKQVALMQPGAPIIDDNNAIDLKVAASNSAKSGHLAPEEAIENKPSFGAMTRISRERTHLTDKQKSFLQELTIKYNQKTKGSKAYAQKHRSYMSDPRVVSGFKPLTKEIIYPIVVNKSGGSKLWDIDGNEYIDMLNGFGSSIFGHQPDFIKKVLHEQVENGFEIGPQHALAGEVSKMICDLTGFERAAFCNNGSEAVLGTMRIARTVTGRSLIVAFSGSYHGIFDEVLVIGTKNLKSYPAAPGIMPEALKNILILDYGTKESLEIIKERANELAAVLVEPVQSRRPEFRPVEFLKQVREITALSGTVLIFDEVITGFRAHPGGAQEIFGIKADIASYGKVVGGGLPIGVIAGKKEFMDALDGGFWQYGDSSFPEAGVTYFAGTFVRHPLALATTKATLQYMKHKGPRFQAMLNEKGDRLAEPLNREFEKRKLPAFIAHFGSLWKLKFTEEVPYSELLFTLLRLKGVHIWDGFPCFITEAHTNEEIDHVIKLFIESIDEMIVAEFFKGNSFIEDSLNGSALPSYFSTPPVPDAKLGRDEQGDPAWYISDKNKPGKFLRVGLK